MDSDSDDESYIISAERKAKQNYLNEEIIYNNYDPELFMMFCSKMKEPDIDCWTFDELQECVQNFKMTYRRGQTLKEILASEAEAEKLKKTKRRPSDPAKPISSSSSQTSLSPHPSQFNRPEGLESSSSNIHEVNRSATVKVEACPHLQISKSTQDLPKHESSKISYASNKPGVIKAQEPDLVKIHDPLPKDPSFLRTESLKISNASSKPGEIRSQEPKVVKIPDPLKVMESTIDPLCQVKNSSKTAQNIAKSGVSTYQDSSYSNSLSSFLETPDDMFIVRCRKLEENELAACKNLEFILKEPELVDAGLFSLNYYVYPIYTSPLKWECKRRYTEFLWLQKFLVLTIPGQYIPAIPPNSQSISFQESAVVYKRKSILNKFVTALARNKMLLSMPVVENFFKLKTKDEFTDYMNSFEKKAKKPQNLEILFNEESFLQCSLADKSSHAEALTKYVANAENIEKKLKKQSGNVLKELKAIEEDYKSIGKLMQDLLVLQEQIPIKSNAGAVFGSLNKGFERLSKQEAERGKLFSEHFRTHFKFNYLQKTQLKELLKTREAAYSDYTKAEKSQKNLHNFREMFGFLNLKVVGEVSRVIQEDNELDKINFSSFARKATDLTTDLHTIWTEMTTHLLTI